MNRFSRPTTTFLFPAPKRRIQDFIHIHRISLRVEDNDAHRGLVDKTIEEIARLQDLLFEPHPLGDVAGNALNPDHLLRL